MYKSDLKRYLKEQLEDPSFPTVSLFNLEQDPQEMNNLADKYPTLVEELLNEAEAVIKKAPKQWRGFFVHTEAPVSPQHNWVALLRTLGTKYKEIVPFGIYLKDSEDLTKLTYVSIAGEQVTELTIVCAKVVIVYIVLPILLLIFCVKNILTRMP